MRKSRQRNGGKSNHFLSRLLEQNVALEGRKMKANVKKMEVKGLPICFREL